MCQVYKIMKSAQKQMILAITFIFLDALRSLLPGNRAQMMLPSVVCIWLLLITNVQRKRCHPRMVCSATTTELSPCIACCYNDDSHLETKISKMVLPGWDFYGVVNPTREMAEASDGSSEILVLLTSAAKPSLTSKWVDGFPLWFPSETNHCPSVYKCFSVSKFPLLKCEFAAQSL